MYIHKGAAANGGGTVRQAVLGVFGGLALAGIGMFWWQGRAAVERSAPPPPMADTTPAPDTLPLADPGNMTGPAPPEMSDLSREEQRFFRYDRNRDRLITRNEMLSTRTEGFRALDKDGNNLLTFEEWAVATVDPFEKADSDRDERLTPREFAATAPKPAAKKPACKC